jgi:hypothetical protein
MAKTSEVIFGGKWQETPVKRQFLDLFKTPIFTLFFEKKSIREEMSFYSEFFGRNGD